MAVAAKRNRKREPTDWQEWHSPTEPVEVEIAKKPRRIVQTCRRRIVDARLWDSMSPQQQDAALIIEEGFRILTAGQRIKLQSVERVSPGHFNYEKVARAERRYWEWAIEAVKRRIDHSAIIDILAFGKPLADIDRRRRKKKGYARLALREGLDLFCEMQGWPTPDVGG